MLHIFRILGKHLEALSDMVGGGFDLDWYYRLYDRVKDELLPFVQA